MKTCPYCAETIQDEAIVCRFCNRDLRTPVQPSSPPPAANPAPPKKANTGWAPIIIVLVITAIVALYVLSRSSAAPSTCSVSAVKQFSSETLALLSEFDDANNIASTTSRIALSGPLSQMQAARRKLINVTTPPCLLPTRDKYAESMDYVIQAYQFFIQDFPQSSIDGMFTKATDALRTANKTLTDITACAPNCP